MHERTQKPDDGVWVNLEAFGGGEPSPLMMTELHPDPIRKFVVVAVVALDTSRLGIELVGGTEEPESKAVPRERRTGLVAPEHLPAIVAAYNGGFRARHGSHGMQIAEDEYLPMKDGSCTLLALADGTFAIGTHPLVSPEGKAVRFARQAPACLIEGGALHSELGPTTRKWGAAENGDKEIRRSAMALGPKGELYFAIGDWVTAERLAEALRHLGAESAIQLDINYSFTRFVLFGRKDDGSTVASSPLLKELKFTQSEYVKSPSHRDFFYLWRKDREGSR